MYIYVCADVGMYNSMRLHMYMYAVLIVENKLEKTVLGRVTHMQTSSINTDFI